MQLNIPLIMQSMKFYELSANDLAHKIGESTSFVNMLLSGCNHDMITIAAIKKLCIALSINKKHILIY